MQARSEGLRKQALAAQAVVNGLFALLVLLPIGQGRYELAGIILVLFVAVTVFMFLSYLIGHAVAVRVARGSHPGWVYVVFPVLANSLFLVGGLLILGGVL